MSEELKSFFFMEEGNKFFLHTFIARREKRKKNENEITLQIFHFKFSSFNSP